MDAPSWGGHRIDSVCVSTMRVVYVLMFNRCKAWKMGEDMAITVCILYVYVVITFSRLGTN